MTYQPCPIQQRALKTWYPQNHELHTDPLHPLAGLAGEAGELLNLWKKDTYKPGFKATKEQWLDELGDLLYYLAIALYQIEVPVISTPTITDGDILYCIAAMSDSASTILWEFVRGSQTKLGRMAQLILVIHPLKTFVNHFGCSLDELSKMNREKLKDGKHSWPESDSREYDKI